MRFHDDGLFRLFADEPIRQKNGILIGGLIGLIGSVLAAIALYYRSFTLFTLSTLILGGATVFNQYYRFAAAEVSDNDAWNKKRPHW